MKATLSIGLLATIGVPLLLASALAQQQGDYVRPTPASRATDIIRAQTAEPVRSSQLGVISETAPRFVPVPEASFMSSPIDGPNSAPIYGLSTVSTNSAESVLARRAEEMARKLGEAKSESERSQIKTELTDLLEKQFGLRQKRHQEEIAALEAKVKKLKELVEKRQENRREIIAKRLDQILSNAEGLGW